MIYLKHNNDLTEHHAATTLLRFFSGPIALAIDARLRVKVPDKHHRDTWTIDQVHEAISYCLAEANPFDGTRYSPTPIPTPGRTSEVVTSVAPSPGANEIHLKTEDFE